MLSYKANIFSPLYKCHTNVKSSNNPLLRPPALKFTSTFWLMLEAGKMCIFAKKLKKEKCINKEPQSKTLLLQTEKYFTMLR